MSDSPRFDVSSKREPLALFRDRSDLRVRLGRAVAQDVRLVMIEGAYALEQVHGQSQRNAYEAVRHEEGRRAKLYFPAVDREDAIEAETETFLDKIGGLGLLMSAMVEKNALTENDIAELSAILEKAGGKL